MVPNFNLRASHTYFTRFLDAHCQQQWASLGVKFSGEKKRREVEKPMGDHGRSMGGHVRSVGVMGGQWGVLRGQWGVMGGQWVVLGGQWEVKGGSRQVTRRLQNAHCQRYSRAEALPFIFWLRYRSPMKTKKVRIRDKVDFATKTRICSIEAWRRKFPTAPNVAIKQHI